MNYEDTGYFGALFHGHYRRGGVNVGETFVPDFNEINEFLADFVTMSEEVAVDQLKDHKAPGLDGLPSKF